ncbi:Fatty acid hydroxylase domain-containing [Argiope bruennichi]|uniref:Fatty acid hydroxylase domain-containing n=1 Tax=Argiope bruennichi TaxID=94029 RepID=A0A8T0FEF3_ARGBR|nr:Fatty acid hydroxylase domain-containing [Argiope bruennichi]
MKFSEVWRDSKQIIYNQLVCGIPMSVLFYHAVTWRGCDTKNVPAFSRIILDLVFIVLLEEIAFYYLHRFFHTPFLFRHIHKVHHKWETPIAITAGLCHPIEHVLCNIFPITLGPVVLGSHLITTWLWFCIATLSTLVLHSGFRILRFPESEVHDLHHIKHSKNYGNVGLMDRLHGTIEFPKRIRT